VRERMWEGEGKRQTPTHDMQQHARHNTHPLQLLPAGGAVRLTEGSGKPASWVCLKGLGVAQRQAEARLRDIPRGRGREAMQSISGTDL
jgi:hypothetical protein